MNQYFKIMFIVVAAIIVAASVFFSDRIARAMTAEEKKRVELWAEANKKLLETMSDDDIDMILKILESNNSIPVIWVDEHRNLLMARNVPEPEKNKETFYKNYIEKLRTKGNFFVVNLANEKQYVYYDDSLLIKQLQYFPFIQLGVIFIFLVVAFFALSNAQKSEQNKVWVGLSKETAHQLGTPISSMLAWHDLLREKYPADSLISEMGNDVNRLQIIADRFSKIGSTPNLQPVSLNTTLQNAVAYIANRTSARVVIQTHFSKEQEFFAALNAPLFEWVIENLCKNAIDAMDGVGNVDIFVKKDVRNVLIDVRDTGKGMERKLFHQIFKPGFTTKKRGWGLGLSLAKRIIEQYHHGKIFVKHSEINAGTTFRIVLKAAR
ncbi:MAG: HAMP domain-containing histidine kinase [Prevotellaceae bacterium]|jgi:signal transduction histidine kinase|nr:HAMP domain-containing histidine kinase [Prevotellaceae bacterium]